MLQHLSDDEYLARVRRQYESRRKFGVICLALGAASLIGAIWGYTYGMAAVREYLEVLTRAPTTHENAVQIVDTSTFFVGFKLGSAITGMAAGAGSMIGYGIYLLWGQRKERMLLEVTKRLSETKYGKVA